VTQLRFRVTYARNDERVLLDEIPDGGDGVLELVVPRDVFEQIRSGELPLSVGYMQGTVKMVGSSGLLMDLLPALDQRDFSRL
jgi:hypothetical protein